jgi:hypothetical protein
MITTILEIPDELLYRVNTTAKLTGKRPRALMVEMIVAYVNHIERRQNCIQNAVEAKNI